MSIFSLFKSRSKTKHKSIVIESKYGIFTSHKFGKNGVVFDGKINWLDDIVDVSLHPSSTESLMADKSLEILCKIAENATEWDKKLRQYGADEFSDDNGMIEIWGNDENNNDNLNESISDTELVNSIDDEIDFHNLYGETFKDEYVPQTVITNASDIKQSNEILCRLIQEEGSEQAKQDLCIKNKALVDKYAWAYGKKYITKLSFEDLEQSGMIGLIKAAEKFDIRKGYSFSTYAVWWVKQAVVRDIQDTGFLIRLPVHVMEKINKISNMESQYVGFGINRAECINAIADELEMPKEYVEHYMYIKDQYLSVASLNTPVGEDENSELIEFISGNDELSAEEIIILKSLKEVLEKQLLRLMPI